MMTDKEKIDAYEKVVEQRKKYTLRRTVRLSLIEAKAIKAGLTVTDAEVDTEIKKRAAKK